MITQNKIMSLDLKINEPIRDIELVKYEDVNGLLPTELKELYQITNGIEGETFNILPLFDENKPKKTWDNLQRANNSATTKFSLDESLLGRFLIFCDIGGNYCAMYDKNDQSIWFEDAEGYHRTDLNLIEFLEGLVQQEKE